jgi:hypothetical protein
VEEGEEAGIGEVGGGARAVGEEVGKERQLVREEAEVQQVGIMKGFLEVRIARYLNLIFS